MTRRSRHALPVPPTDTNVRQSGAPSGRLDGVGPVATHVPGRRAPWSADDYRPTHASPVARVLLNQLASAPVADRWAVLNAARGALAHAAPDRVDVVLRALRLCWNDTGAVTRGGYRRWRAVQSCPEEFASTDLVCSVFGSWDQASAAVGATALADVITTKGYSSQRFSEEDVASALQACALAIGGTPRVKDYVAWAQEVMSNPDREFRRVPLTAISVRRVFGSWENALVDACLPLDGQYRRRGLAGAYEADELRAWVVSAADCCKRANGWLYTGDYDCWAKEQETSAREEGRLVLVPRANTITRRYESWANALVMFGVVSEDLRRAHEALRPGLLTEVQKLDAVRAAIGDCGRSMTMRQYRGWRRRQEHPERLPGDRSLRDTFGGWHAARAAALDRPWSGRQRYDHDDLRAALSRARAELGTDRFGETVYRRWRSSQDDRDDIPEGTVFIVRYGSFVNAREQLLGRGRVHLRWTDDQLKAAAREAATMCGRPLRYASYREWRASQAPRALPTEDLLSQRLGGWRAVQLTAVDAVQRPDSVEAVDETSA